MKKHDNFNKDHHHQHHHHHGFDEGNMAYTLDKSYESLSRIDSMESEKEIYNYNSQQYQYQSNKKNDKKSLFMKYGPIDGNLIYTYGMDAKIEKKYDNKNKINNTRRLTILNDNQNNQIYLKSLLKTQDVQRRKSAEGNLFGFLNQRIISLDSYAPHHPNYILSHQKIIKDYFSPIIESSPQRKFKEASKTRVISRDNDIMNNSDAKKRSSYFSKGNFTIGTPLNNINNNNINNNYNFMEDIRNNNTDKNQNGSITSAQNITKQQGQQQQQSLIKPVQLNQNNISIENNSKQQQQQIGQIGQKINLDEKKEFTMIKRISSINEKCSSIENNDNYNDFISNNNNNDNDKNISDEIIQIEKPNLIKKNTIKQQENIIKQQEINNAIKSSTLSQPLNLPQQIEKLSQIHNLQNNNNTKNNINSNNRNNSNSKTPSNINRNNSSNNKQVSRRTQTQSDFKDFTNQNNNMNNQTNQNINNMNNMNNITKSEQKSKQQNESINMSNQQKIKNGFFFSVHKKNQNSSQTIQKYVTQGGIHSTNSTLGYSEIKNNESESETQQQQIQQQLLLKKELSKMRKTTSSKQMYQKTDRNAIDFNSNNDQGMNVIGGVKSKSKMSQKLFSQVYIQHNPLYKKMNDKNIKKLTLPDIQSKIHNNSSSNTNKSTLSHTLMPLSNNNNNNNNSVNNKGSKNNEQNGMFQEQNKQQLGQSNSVQQIKSIKNQLHRQLSHSKENNRSENKKLSSMINNTNNNNNIGQLNISNSQ